MFWFTIWMVCSLNMKEYAYQPQVAAGGGAPPPPPNRGFQLKCSEQFASADVNDPQLVQEFSQNAPPDYHVLSVDPCIFPGKNSHRYIVRYRSDNFRRCEDIRRVFHDMNTYKPQNCNVGSIGVIPGGYMVEYKQFCMCYRRAFRRKRWSNHPGINQNFNINVPSIDSAGNVIRCDDRDFSCGPQNF